MSNPYAPKKRPVNKPTPAKSEEPKELVVPEGSIADILKWVGEDEERAVLALEAEEAGKKRPSLMKTLKGI